LGCIVEFAARIGIQKPREIHYGKKKVTQFALCKVSSVLPKGFLYFAYLLVDFFKDGFDFRPVKSDESGLRLDVACNTKRILCGLRLAA